MPAPIIAALVSAVLPSLIGTAAEKLLGDDHPLSDVAKSAAVSVAEEVTGIKIVSPQSAETVASRLSDDPDATADFQRILNDKLAILLNAENERIRLQLADVQDARSQTVALTQAGSSIAWGAPVVSLVVLATFGIVLYRVLTAAPAQADPNAAMMLGALTTMASAVVGYWVGSSAGSKAKDEALRARR